MRYAVDLTREHAYIEVEANSVEDTRAKAIDIADAPRSIEWSEGELVDQEIRVGALQEDRGRSP